MATEFNNRQAYFNYFIDNKYDAGIVLLGTEVKSIRDGKLSFNDAFCIIDNNEIWLRGLYIAEYKLGTTNNHIAVHDRKLLLRKKEIRKLQAATKEKGLTIVPLRVFMNEKNLVKVEIGVAKGKKLYDKRETIKKRDNDRELKKYLG
ncbi:MAG: SsrA-binding protein SmpB [Chitinophagaceae bacterium]